MKTSLVITSIATQENPVLNQYAHESHDNGINFFLIGDSKSPSNFHIEHCNYYSLSAQNEISKSFSNLIPVKHYSRKNLGYLEAIKQGAECIIETDDDNIPNPEFWEPRSNSGTSFPISQEGWVNVYKYFAQDNIWPRGLPLVNINDKLPALSGSNTKFAPIQQGLANGNPDVDAIYRLVQKQKDIKFDELSVSLVAGSWCPFNSQNTTWFAEAFPLLYLPSYCSFRMTDIWRSFIAQRIAWTCGWEILFHSATVYQIRNEHNLMKDFIDEIPGYQYNDEISKILNKLKMKEGTENIPENLTMSYRELIKMKLVGKEEMEILKQWLKELAKII